jgi:molybdate transport system substrate-binding protein
MHNYTSRSDDSRPATDHIAVRSPVHLVRCTVHIRVGSRAVFPPSSGHLNSVSAVPPIPGYLASNAVDAAEIKILCASGMREVVSEVQPQLARIAGQQVSISFDEAGELRKRLQGGEIADIAILPRIVLDEVAADDGNIVPATIIDISQSSIGIGVRKDAPKPDIGSAEQFKHVLLAAKAIVVGDPASGGVAAVHVANVFRRLGIMDQLAPKLRLTRDQRNATFVEKGEADIAVQLSNEIRIVPGIEFIAFPPEFARTFMFSAALGSKAKDANVARTILQFLAGPQTAAVVEAKGMDRAAAK